VPSSHSSTTSTTSTSAQFMNVGHICPQSAVMVAGHCHCRSRIPVRVAVVRHFLRENRPLNPAGQLIARLVGVSTMCQARATGSLHPTAKSLPLFKRCRVGHADIALVPMNLSAWLPVLVHGCSALFGPHNPANFL
jgi:hypothetical protein